MNTSVSKSGITRSTLACLLILMAFQCQAESITVAVASNFTQTLHKLVENFEAKSGHEVRLSSASTGKLYTQINHGAPFDVFLSADETRADMLIAEGKGVADMSRVYALGKLVLLSNIKAEGDCQNILQSNSLKWLAIANPQTAPYGAAAREVLEYLDLWKTIEARLVIGENIAQPLQFVSTGSATAGFVAKAMLLQGADINSACTWDVPAELHSPIRQKMVVLSKSAASQAVKDFWVYMQSDDARKIIENDGYDVL